MRKVYALTASIATIGTVFTGSGVCVTFGQGYTSAFVVMIDDCGALWLPS